MHAKICIGQICGSLFLFILLTSVLSQLLAGGALDPVDVSGMNKRPIMASLSRMFF